MSFTTFIQVSGRKLMNGKLTFLHAIISRNLLNAVYIFTVLETLYLLKFTFLNQRIKSLVSSGSLFPLIDLRWPNSTRAKFQR